MSKSKKIFISLIFGLFLSLFPYKFFDAVDTTNIQSATGYKPISQVGKFLYTPTEKELVWRYVLEWCESRGNNNAINPNDLDNTPSYGVFQFKPETLKHYLYRYEIISPEILDTFETADFINLSFDREIMYEVLNRMIGEKDKINWKKEFPYCVEKFGKP